MSFSPTMPVWLFAAIAFLLLCVFGFGRKRRRDASLAAAQPEEPWLRKAAWASGRIPDSSNKTMWGHIMFALVWNMLSAVAMSTSPVTTTKRSSPSISAVAEKTGGATP